MVAKLINKHDAKSLNKYLLGWLKVYDCRGSWVINQEILTLAKASGPFRMEEGISPETCA